MMGALTAVVIAGVQIQRQMKNRRVPWHRV